MDELQVQHFARSLDQLLNRIEQLEERVRQLEELGHYLDQHERER